MAFTEAQKVQIRQYCGYPLFGSTANPNYGFRFWNYYGQLEWIMQNMAPEEELEVLTYYLPNLALLKADIPAVRDNIDTTQAAVWHRNPAELKERYKIYNDLRIDLCNFMGVAPGGGIGVQTAAIFY